MSFLNRREETNAPIFVVRIDENVSAIHERRVNIADANVVTLTSNSQTPPPRIATSDDVALSRRK
jgi:hypothetical protein